MPVIKIQHVCSFSSEDPSHPAENLLSLETYRKWKCAAAGEKQAVVLLQFEKATQIHSIDIGNDGSAFTEVLVARSTSPDEYQVLLVTSSFMSPVDSKAWSNTSRVRIFGKEKLSKGVVEQKWDRVKIVCTQPFNKTEKYGLAFVKFHSPPDSSQEGDAPTPTPVPATSSSSKSPQKLGAFSLRESTKDLPSGSLFFRKEQPKSARVSTSPSTAAQARMASAAALKADQSDSPRRRGDQSKRSTDTKKSPPPSSSSKRSSSEKHSSVTPPAKKSKAADISTGSKSRVQDPSSQIMKGVVLSLSGFKNPFRGELREKAVEMGAQYEPDWSPSCTHLVCAFSNTPKFNQVKAKGGLIVKKEWVLDSHVKKRRLPARKYRLSSGSGSSSSEDERYDRKEGDIFGKAGSSGGGGGRGDTAAASSATAEKKNGTGGVDKDARTTPETEDTLPLDEGMGAGRDKGGSTDEEDPYGGSTDEEGMDTDVVVKRKPLPPPARDDDSSECDTDDEIERVRQQQREKGDATRGSTAEEDSGQENAKSTEDSSVAVQKPLTDLPDFFSKCRFLLYGTFSPPDRKLVSRYITAYSGHMEEYMSEKVTHVLTQEDWDENFDQALTENSSLAFVRPKWIFVCHAKQSCVPYQPYIVVPS